MKCFFVNASRCHGLSDEVIFSERQIEVINKSVIRSTGGLFFEAIEEERKLITIKTPLKIKVNRRKVNLFLLCMLNNRQTYYSIFYTYTQAIPLNKQSNNLAEQQVHVMR
jgi:hypothetical protein